MSLNKILIVEDELLIAKVCERFFQRKEIANIKTVCAYKDAVESIQEQFPDLILLDVQLRGKRDGIDLAEWIRKQSNVPIIFSTGNSFHGSKERLDKIDNKCFLSKPIKMEQLDSAMADFDLT